MKRGIGMLAAALVVCACARHADAPTPRPATASCDAPRCTDATHATCCDGSGAPHSDDCAATGRVCRRGVCAKPACAPGSVHCFEGNVYRCDASGSARAPVEDCRKKNQICEQGDAGPARCSAGCDPGYMNLVLADYDCERCDYAGVPFCSEDGPETGCARTLCQKGELGFGAGPVTCHRDTAGLVVPGSERGGACDPSTGTRAVRFRVCAGGAERERVRSDKCATP